MTSEEMERAIEFLTNRQAKNRCDILSLNEVVNKLAEGFLQTREQIDVRRRERLEAEAYRQGATERMDADRQDIRKAISRLSVSNEGTRDLAEKVAKELAATTTQRVTALETARED